MSAPTVPMPHLPEQQQDLLIDLFSESPSSVQQNQGIEAVRQYGLALATIICHYAPAGSDQTDAVRKVREAVMTAHAAIMLNGLNYHGLEMHPPGPLPGKEGD